MDDNLYDEFGNYLGDDLDSDEDDEDQEMVHSQPAQPAQPAHAPLEGYDDDEDDDPEIAAQNDLRISTLAQVDGEIPISLSSTYLIYSLSQPTKPSSLARRQALLSFC